MRFVNMSHSIAAALKTIRRNFSQVVHPLTLRRYLIQSFLILRHDGWAALVHRFRLKIYSRRRAPVGEIQTYSIESSCHRLTFRDCSRPIVSIVIPFYNHPLFTFSCLKSILEHPPDVSYEIILVDDKSDDPEIPKMLDNIGNVEVIRNKRNSGFIESCNRGARRARGDFLVFLNNDTMVTSGWLQALLRAYDTVPCAGLVGAKLIYPDGRLQEAGGIVWRDGSAWNYGRFDDPRRPEYNYLRQVDYCSGACILVSRSVFLEMGGFDDLYAPAYYEDADLAFRLRRAGKKVVYQPHAEIVHFEGISSGADVHKGVKRYQERNRHKFFERWRQTLSTHRNNGIRPELEKDRYVDKRILVADARMITPDRDSGSVRMFHLLNILTAMEYQVTFAAADLNCQQPYVHDLQNRGIEVIHAPYVTSFDAYLSEWGGLFDAVMLSRVDLADKLMDLVKTHCPDAFVIFDTVDVHFIREQRMAEVMRSASLLWIAEKRKDQELAIAARADVTLVVSPIEKQVLDQILPDARIEILSNIHTIHETNHGFQGREHVFFVGGFEHPPNIDAVLYYHREIMPLLRERLAGVNTYIVGSNPPPAVHDMQASDFIVTGYVKDIEPYLHQCRLSIAPLRFGAGVKGKINLSMSYGVPVVATPVAVEGMYLTHGVDVMTADTPRAFVDALVQVYTDETRWRMLSENGKSNVRAHFGMEKARETLTRIFGREHLPVNRAGYNNQ